QTDRPTRWRQVRGGIADNASLRISADFIYPRNRRLERIETARSNSEGERRPPTTAPGIGERVGLLAHAGTRLHRSTPGSAATAVGASTGIMAASGGRLMQGTAPGGYVGEDRAFCASSTLLCASVRVHRVASGSRCVHHCLEFPHHPVRTPPCA